MVRVKRWRGTRALGEKAGIIVQRELAIAEARGDIESQLGFIQT
jgi:hypothetical protein